MRSRIAQGALVVAGLLIALYPFTLGATPSVTCRGVSMGPGQTCAKADGGSVQTYEDRFRTANDAKPIVFVVGLAVAGFGAVLLVGASRRDRRPDSPESGPNRQRHAV